MNNGQIERFLSEEGSYDETMNTKFDGDIPHMASPWKHSIVVEGMWLILSLKLYFVLKLIWNFISIDIALFASTFNSKRQKTMNVTQNLLLELYPTFDLEDVPHERINATFKVYPMLPFLIKVSTFSLCCHVYTYFIH